MRKSYSACDVHFSDKPNYSGRYVEQVKARAKCSSRFTSTFTIGDQNGKYLMPFQSEINQYEVFDIGNLMNLIYFNNGVLF